MYAVHLQCQWKPFSVSSSPSLTFYPVDFIIQMCNHIYVKHSFFSKLTMSQTSWEFDTRRHFKDGGNQLGSEYPNTELHLARFPNIMLHTNKT